MPRYKVGDHVQRIGPLIPTYMHNGVVIRVIPAREGLPDIFDEYEVDFKVTRAIFYETQIEPSSHGESRSR